MLVLRCTAHTRSNRSRRRNTPAAVFQGQCPLGLSSMGGAVALEGGGDRDTGTHTSQLRAIRGSKPSKRRSVMEPRRSLVSQGSLVASLGTGLPPSCPTAIPEPEPQPGVPGQVDDWTGPRLGGRIVIALLPWRASSPLLFQGPGAHRHRRSDGKKTTRHPHRTAFAPLGPHRRGLGGPTPASDESPKLNHDTAAATLQKLSGC